MVTARHLPRPPAGPSSEGEGGQSAPTRSDPQSDGLVSENGFNKDPGKKWVSTRLSAFWNNAKLF